MARNTIIVGNGLGMALDTNFFRLENALQEIWDDGVTLTADEKHLVERCLHAQGIFDFPHGEDHLDTLHRAVLSCQFLNSVAEIGIVNPWLTPNGQLFPDAVRKFLTSVSWRLHRFNGTTLPTCFTTPLIQHIRDNKSHIATLNYDNLLYQSLIDAEILNGYHGELVDGFWGTGFHEGHLVRKNYNKFGYYLHLHGSPLFVGDNDTPYKQSQPTARMIPTNHLVLAYVKHKLSIINNSSVLTAYWEYLYKALREGNKIIVFGYSGLDDHLNDAIKLCSVNIPIIVIEWEGAGNKDARERFWKNRLLERPDGDFELIRLSNILEFQDWDR